MPTHELTRFPPILQLACIVLLSLYVAVSIIGRLSPRFRWLWRDPRKRIRFGHIVEYTLIPAAMLAGAIAAVAYNWVYRAPLDGGWATSDLVLGPGGALLGGLLIVAASILGRDADEMDAGSLRSWLPFVLMISGMALMAGGIFSFGKRSSPRPNGDLSAPHSVRSKLGRG